MRLLGSWALSRVNCEHAAAGLALFATNAIADIRLSAVLLDEVQATCGKRVVGVLADAGGGKTQLAAQLTAPAPDRPAGILLHGRNLHASHSLNDLARTVVIQGVPVVSMEALVAALDAAGQRAHRRLPIVIDGLNEAEDPRNWKPLVAALDQILRSYPYAFIVCTVRSAFADETLPLDIYRLEIPDFGRDAIAAIRQYFGYYRINAADAPVPIQLLKHPLMLRLFCEVTNPTREKIVGIEAMPQSLTALFDEYLQQATERITQLTPHTRRYLQQDVREALDKIGAALWEEKARTLDLATLRESVDGVGRPWNDSIVRALEQEGLLLRYPSESAAGASMGMAYDALAGHLVADKILTTQGQAGFETWLRSPTTMAALVGDFPDRHPLASDIFTGLAGLVPRRLHRRQLWTMLDEPLRTIALRAAANLEGAYLDAATVQALSSLAVQVSTGHRDLLNRLWETRGSPDHPLNADFLERVLRPMDLANRDLRWSEWIRRNHEELIIDLRRLEQRWQLSKTSRSQSQRLRARWVMWTLTSTVRELRDRATRGLYWFGRWDPAFLFKLTLESLSINDPYVSERMLAAAYGACMALHCRPKRPRFRSTLLPAFAKRVYEKMFAPSAPASTTHALSRDFARRIVDLAVFHVPSLLSVSERDRCSPPFKEGGIRQWGIMDDPNKGKYRHGNSPLGMDFENYTIGGLVPKRSNYDYEDEEYKRVVGQIIWRIYQFGYSLEAFGEIDKEVADGRYHGRALRPVIERYGKKYARIAYFEQYGLREDEGLLLTEWHDKEERPSDTDIDPSFPDHPHKLRLINDFLGDRSGEIGTWVQHGPTPEFKRYLVQSMVGQVPGPWLLLDGRCSQRDNDAERLGFVAIQCFLLLEDDLAEFIGLLKKEPPRGKWLPDVSEDHLTFAGEVPWCKTFPHNTLHTVDFVIGTTKVRVRPNDSWSNAHFLLNFGGLEQTIGPAKRPKFEEVNLYKRIPVYVPARYNCFSASDTIERPSSAVVAKELAERFRLWMSLPKWDMRDQVGRLCSIATSVGSFADYEAHLFFRKEPIDELLASDDLALVWVAWGERQHFAERHTRSSGPSHGYKYFQQVYRYTGGQPRRVI